MDLRKKGNWTLGKMVFGGKNIRKNRNLENSNMQVCKFGKRKIRKNENLKKQKNGNFEKRKF